MSNEQAKKWHQSKGVWTGIVQTGLGLAMIFGIELPAEIVDPLVGEGFAEAMATASSPIGYANVIFGVLGTYFRLIAKRAINEGVEDVKDIVRKPIDWIVGIFRKKKNHDQ